MNPRHLLAIISAEIRKTFTRGNALGALVLAVAVGLVAVGAMKWTQNAGSEAVFNGQPVSNLIQASGAAVGSWALQMRNFYVLPLLLLLATGSSVAGELKDHSFRELILRPVPRWSVIIGKYAALLVLSAATLLLTGLVALVPGLALFGFEGDEVSVLLGYAASLLSDAGLLALGILASMLLRSVGGVVVGVALFLMADGLLRLALKGASMLGMTSADAIARWMPGRALDVWKGAASEAGWDPYAFAGLAVLVLVCLGVSMLSFRKMDVP